MPAATLILFAKFPTAGSVKTRLVPALGAEGAAKLAEAFLLDLTERLSRELSADFTCVLCFDPPGAEAGFRSLLAAVPEGLARFEFVPQCAGGLGERLANALQTISATHPAPHVFIGTDAPDLSANQISTAAYLSNFGSACITPATDGGYVLLALPDESPPGVFEHILWSTRETAKLQARQLERCGIECIFSNPWPDIDEPCDVRLLKERLERDPSLAPRTLQFLRNREAQNPPDITQ